LAYSGAASLTAFGFGNVITGQNSGAVATVAQVIATSVSAGTLIVTLSADNVVDADFEDGENILVGGSTVAQVNGSTTDLYIQPTQIVSYENPDHGQVVDRLGQAYVRFADGAASVDSFSKLRVQEPSLLGLYEFKYDNRANLMANIELVSGSILFESGTGASLLQNDVDNGSFAQRTSHIYHKYISGQSQLWESSVIVGDDGKSNVVRRWGLFDDEDGFFFELSGTQKAFIIRSTINGSTSDNRILQSNWNRDTFDGGNGASNRSDISLDMSKANDYWIDYSWPTGQTRFGIVEDGVRRIAHIEQIANQGTVPFTRNGSLPVRWEQENVGVAASISELRCFSTRVWTEGDFMPRDVSRRFSQGTGQISVSNTETPIISVKPNLTSSNGRTNHAVMLFDFITGYAISGSNEDQVKINVYASSDAALLGETYSSTPTGALFEVDTDATTFFGGTKVAEIFVRGNFIQDIAKYTNYVGESNFKLWADGTQITVVFTAETSRSGSVADMEFNLGWLEVID
jgi:hypothetical protein